MQPFDTEFGGHRDQTYEWGDGGAAPLLPPILPVKTRCSNPERFIFLD